LILQYNDTTSTPNSYNSLCLGRATANNAILAECSANSVVALKIAAANTYIPASGTRTIRLQSQGITGNVSCLAVNSSGTAKFDDCTASSTSLTLDSSGVISTPAGNLCMTQPPLPPYGASNVARFKSCSGSPGQKFSLNQIGNSDRITISPALSAYCLENSLAYSSCNGYGVQQWRILN
jgi:hypothetical protein